MRTIDEVACELLMTPGLNQRQATLISELLFIAKQASTTAERRRAWDRERKRKVKVVPPVSTGIPPEKGGNGLYVETPMYKPCSDGTKVKVRRARGKKIPLPPEFHPNDNHYEIGARFSYQPDWVDDQCDLMRGWAIENSKLKADWNLTFENWLKRGGTNAKHRANYPISSKPEARTLSRATSFARGALQHLASITTARPKDGEIQGFDDVATEFSLKSTG